MSAFLSSGPTGRPADQPTYPPSDPQTNQLTDRPTNQPTNQPTDRPTDQPTDRPTDRPTNQPTDRPTDQPINRPTNQPTDRPTNRPTDIKRHRLLSPIGQSSCFTNSAVQNNNIRTYWEPRRSVKLMLRWRCEMCGVLALCSMFLSEVSRCIQWLISYKPHSFVPHVVQNSILKFEIL